VAAATGSYATLAPLVPRNLKYSYGVERPGGAIAYWRSLEPKQHPIRILAALLRMPPTHTQGLYVWPLAYSVPPDKLTPAQLRLLRPLFGPKDVRAWKSFGGYFSWRVGIDAKGRWVFFISGD
jgi:hypothetical protein